MIKNEQQSAREEEEKVLREPYTLSFNVMPLSWIWEKKNENKQRNETVSKQVLNNKNK